MDRFLYESFAVVIDPKVTLALNSTVQTTSSQNFQLTITGEAPCKSDAPK